MDDREQFIIAAGLVCDNKIIASNAIMVEMFKDVEITNYGNVELINMLEPGEYEIVKAKKKRSLDANAYAWVLIDKIAAVLRMT